MLDILINSIQWIFLPEAVIALGILMFLEVIFIFYNIKNYSKKRNNISFLKKD